MKRLLLVFAGLMVGMAHAQSFDWNRAWSGCSAEASAFDAESRRQSTPEHTARKVMRYVEEVTGTPPTAAKLRAKMDEDRGVLRDSKKWADLIQLSSKLALCGTTAALNQLQGGSTQAAAAPSNPVAQREPQVENDRCVIVNPSTSSLVSKCSTRVSVGWCFVPNDPSASTSIHCDEQKFGQAELDPGERIALQENALIAWTTCKSPKRVADLQYVKGVGLNGKCRR
ncbi:hypothetical protein [Hydrogenophaga sp. MI9]|uniref:hypothetical protein n=1 Tax=Hydrogenophaga sp. MI9 TaxID=3453719 RepID=UPI003EEF24FC